MATSGLLNTDTLSDEVFDESQARAPAKRCDRHSHKPIDMYCQKHDKVGCSTCMADDHRSCQNTFYILEFIRDNSYQSVSRQIQTKLSKINKTLADEASKYKQDKQRLLKRKAELLADIRKLRQEINDQFDELEKNSIDEIEDKVKCLEGKIDNILKQIVAHKARVTTARNKLAFPHPNQADVFVNMKIAEDVANVANEYMEDTNMKCTVEELDFKPDRTIFTQLEQNIALWLQTENSIKYASSLFQIRGDNSYCIKVKSDTEDCYISSACCLKDGPIIIADHNNNKLKQLRGYNYTVTDYYDLPEKPWQVCAISNTDVALTLPLQHEVRFISVEEKMKGTNKIKTGFECYGLAYTNNNLYISDASTSVYVYTLFGKKLQHFMETKPGQKLFSNIHSIAVSKDGTRIYVADFYNGLIVLDNNGQVITTSNGKQFCGANCCYITKAGSVLVSTYGSSVLQFTPDGELIGEVIKADSEGRSEILSVCCNQQMSRMFVCSIDANIGVYGI